MADVGFYHLTRTTAAEALCALLGRTLAAGQRAVVRCGSDATLAALDQALWLSPDSDWLPHGTTDPEMQPIFLTLEDASPNGARFLFLTDSTETATPQVYARIFDVFDGTDPQAVQVARLRWKRLKSDGHLLSYRRQEAKGWTSGQDGEPPAALHVQPT